MTSKDDKVRAAIAEQASEWFVANDEAPLGVQDSAALVAWLKASPAHVEEFLGVAVLARDLHIAGAGLEPSLEALVARARAEDAGAVEPFRPSRVTITAPNGPGHRWQFAAISAAAVALASLALFWWNFRPVTREPAPAAAALHFETRHGEQQTHRLADNSVLHLNTDTAVTVRYSPTQRLVVLVSGEADFEVAHDPQRVFRVLAGPAEVMDLGTQFDVRRNGDATVVTVAEGRVSVAPSQMPGEGGARSSQSHPRQRVQLSANQQISVAEGQWPATAITVDAQRARAWLHRQISFDHEPLERVAAEFNRYAPKPIEITAPALRTLEVSGVFSTDDPEEFLAFLRSLEGVRVEVTATRIRVSQK